MSYQRAKYCWRGLLMAGGLISLIYISVTVFKFEASNSSSGLRISVSAGKFEQHDRGETYTKLSSPDLNEHNNSRFNVNNERGYPDLTKYDVPRLSYSKLPRVLNKTEYNEVRHLLQHIHWMFTENNITYIMAYGTLLGSYFTHDILPWDDDLDLLVRLSDKQKIVDLIVNNNTNYPHIAGIVHEKHIAKMIKLYHPYSDHAGKYPWRWPFADVAYYSENKTDVWVSQKGKNIRMKRDHFYPLHLRPFMGMWLPAQREPRLFFKMNYKKFTCKYQGWNHRLEKRKQSVNKETDCVKVEEYYPVVYRTSHKGGVMETLRLNGTDIYTVYVDEPANSPSPSPFTFD